MENSQGIFEPIVDTARDYGRSTLELLKLKAVDKTADVAGTTVSRVISIVALSMFFLIGNIGLALWLGDLLGRTCYGFFAVSGFYLLAGILLYFVLHSWIKARVGNSIIHSALN